MRSFSALALRQVRARRLRALLTAAGIVLGVGDDPRRPAAQRRRSSARSPTSSTPSTGETDLVVSGSQSSGAHGPSTLRQVRRTEGVEQAVGNIQARFNLVEASSRSRARAAADAARGLRPRRRGREARGRGDRRAAQRRRRGPGGRGLQRHRDRRRPRPAPRPRDRAPGELGGRQRARGRRPRPARDAGGRQRRFEVVGLFQFSTGLDFGGQGFATMPLGAARELMDKPHGFDEVERRRRGRRGHDRRACSKRLERRLEHGRRRSRPRTPRADEVESQLQAFNVILYFFAAMALFVGGFLIFNSFNMTVLQRIREIGMLRTLGATRRMVVRSVLREARAARPGRHRARDRARRPARARA